MEKELEFNNGECRFKGMVEIVSSMVNGETRYTVTQYVEDKLYGAPWKNIHPDDVDTIANRQEKGVMKVLRGMAEKYSGHPIEKKLRKNGYADPE